MKTYKFVQLVENPDQGDYEPPEEQDLDPWQLEILDELAVDIIERELELQNIIDDVVAA